MAVITINKCSPGVNVPVVFDTYLNIIADRPRVRPGSRCMIKSNRLFNLSSKLSTFLRCDKK